MKILVINSGSSSIKYQLFDMNKQSVLVAGILEEIGRTESKLKHRKSNGNGEFIEFTHIQSVHDHAEGFRVIMDFLAHPTKGWDLSDLSGVGHRIVHGGEAFHSPTLIDKEVISTIRAMIPLAPLHNPANLSGVELALKQFQAVPQVAIFDTAFHQSMPAHAFRYALPNEMYTDYRVRRYGFHGTSHQYVAKQAAGWLNLPLSSVNLISLHLGNGASATAIKQGRSIDTSMGMTPLEGLVMGTRCGDIDAAVQGYLVRVTGKTYEEIGTIFEKESGLQGICGSSDMREVVRLAESGDRFGVLALDMFCYRIKKYIGAYFAVLGRVDAVVFTGGIGENSPIVRRNCCEGLDSLGIVVDEGRNHYRGREPFSIQPEESRVKVLVIPTNEELEIAMQTLELIQARQASGT
jgi:acetate kinase